ncbi:MAG: VWA domain-containing protein [Kiloniellaceae bacterium]
MVKVTPSGEALASDVVRSIDVADQSDIVLDASLLFSAEFTRLGDDLVLQGPDGAEVLLRDYFAQLSPPPLETAEGASLAPGTVAILAGPAVPLSFAQAGDAELDRPIGEVSSLNGIARVQKADGTRTNLHEGDPIFQGDVVSTGVGSDLGILFIDDTVFSLSSNARMVIDELIYNPGSTTNAMGISLIQGTFVFVTGKVAPSGEMDVATPVGTIGIRGTTVGVRIATFGGATRIANIENPETGETGSFTFSNFGGFAQFTQANHFLEVRSAAVIPGMPAPASSQAISDVFGRPLNSATEIQRSLGRDQTDPPPTTPQETDPQQGELTQDQIDALLSQLVIETGAGGDQPLGEGSSFAAGLTLSGLGQDAFGLAASGLLPSGTLNGVDISGFGLIGFDDGFAFLVPSVTSAPVEGEAPPAINVVYLIDISGSMSRGSDGRAPSPSSPSRLDLAKQALLALNQQLIDDGLADRVTIKIIAFRAHTDISVIDARSVEFDGPDDSGLEAFVNGLRADGGTQYEGPLQVAANWLREDVDPGDGITERHEDALNFVYFFGDGGDDYLPDASLVADLYDNGSGVPNISNLTIEAFGIGTPGTANFSTDQLGKVETGSLGNGDQVTVISNAGDIEEIFPPTPSTGEAVDEDPAAAEALQLADLVGDADLDIDTLLLVDGREAEIPAAASTESGEAAATVQPAGASLAVAAGIPLADLNSEELTALTQA